MEMAREVHRLIFADLSSLEKLRRFAQQNKVGIVFSGATTSKTDRQVLREVFPDVVERRRSPTAKGFLPATKQDNWCGEHPDSRARLDVVASWGKEPRPGAHPAADGRRSAARSPMKRNLRIVIPEIYDS